MVTHLLLRDRVVHQHQLRQLGEGRHDIQVRQLGHLVRGQDQVRQVGYRIREGGLDASDAVARKQKRRYPRRQGEVSQDLDIVVGEVDGVEGLRRSVTRTRPEPGGREKKNLRQQHPGSQWRGFGVLFTPKRQLYQLCSFTDQKCSICSFQNAPRRSSSRSLRGLR